MADQKYELLIVIRTQQELAGTLDTVIGQLKAVDDAGAKTFGPSGKAALGAQALAGVQGVLAKASKDTGQALGEEAAKTGEVALVLRAITDARKGGAAATRAFQATLKGVPTDILREISATRDLVKQVDLLSGAWGGASSTSEILGSVLKGIPDEYVRLTIATNAATIAQKEWEGRGAKATGIGHSIAAAQAEATRSIDQTVKANQDFIAGSNLFPAAIAKGSRSVDEASAAFGRMREVTRSVQPALTAFKDGVSTVDTGVLRAIASSKEFSTVFGGIANVLGFSGAATRAFAAGAKDSVGATTQARLAAKALGVVHDELERRTRGSTDATQAGERAASAIGRTLVTTTATVGNQLLRLGGITSGFAGQTLGRQLLTGISRSSREFQLLGATAARTGAAVAGAGEEASGAADGIAAVGASAGPATIAIAAIAIAALGTLGAFKKLLEASIAVSQAFESVAVRAPKAAFAELERSVFNLSGATGVAFEDLAGATGRALLKVGGDASQAQRLVKVATDLALAGQEQLGVSVERLGDIMRTYGLSIAEVKDVSNLLLLSQVNSREEFSKIADGLVQLAPQAQKLGISLKDLGASLAGVVASGVPAQQATFGLRSIFAELEKDTSATRKTLRGLQVDLSPEAFRAKGLIGVLQEAERALNRNNASLSKFLGESRRFPTVLALLGNAAGPAGAILRGLATGADQAADGIARLQSLPGRQLANFLNELRVLFVELGTALATIVGPTVQHFTELLREFNALAAEHPEGVERAIKAISESAIDAASGVPFLGKILTTLAGATMPAVGKAIDVATDKIKDLRKELAGPISAPQIEDFPLGNAPSRVKQIDAISAAMSTAAERLQRVFDVDVEATFVATLTDLIDQGGSATEIVKKLDEALQRHGDITLAASAYSRIFQTASEKGAEAIEQEAAKTNLLVEALKRRGGDTTALVAKIERQRAASLASNEALALQERISLRAGQALNALSNSLFHVAETQQAARLALKPFLDDLARLDELSRRGGTHDTTQSPFDISRDLTKSKAAFEGIDASIETWKDGQRTIIEQLDVIVSRAQDYANFAESQGFVEAAKSIRAEIARLKGSVIAEQEGGFGGGFGRGIQDFIRQAQDGFALGKAAALDFANSSVDAMSNFLLSLGKGSDGIKQFAIAILQAIEQMIAKIIAFGIVSSVFDSFGGPLGAFFGFGGPPAREKGGRVRKGKPYVVGERGAEVLVPEEDGYILSHADSLTIAREAATPGRQRHFAEGGVHEGEMVGAEDRRSPRGAVAGIARAFRAVALNQAKAARSTRNLLIQVLSGRPRPDSVGAPERAASLPGGLPVGVPAVFRLITREAAKAVESLPELQRLKPGPGEIERVRNERLRPARSYEAERSVAGFRQASRIAAGLALALLPVAYPRASAATISPSSVAHKVAALPTLRLERGGVVGGSIAALERPQTAPTVYRMAAGGVIDRIIRSISGGVDVNLVDTVQDKKGLPGRAKRVLPVPDGYRGALPKEARQPSRRLIAGLARFIPALAEIDRAAKPARRSAPTDVGVRLAQTTIGAQARGLDGLRGEPGLRGADAAGGIVRLLRSAATSIGVLARTITSTPPPASQAGSTFGARPKPSGVGASGTPGGDPAARRGASGQASLLSPSTAPSGPVPARGVAPPIRDRRTAPSDVAREKASKGFGVAMQFASGVLFHLSKLLPAPVTSRAFAMGGVATSPTLALFAEKPGKAEAFVPLDGPNRGIPVEFRNLPKAPPTFYQGPGAAQAPRNVNINITLVSQSLDPRTAGDVILAQMPQITRALAKAIDDGNDQNLNGAIRGAGR